MNVETGAETAQFPEKEYINGITVAVHVLWNNILVTSDFMYIFLFLKNR